MKGRLEHIKDWSALARSANYNVGALARLCQVSTRQLERFFQTKHACSPHQWLREVRLRRAVELISRQESLKQVAAELGYKDQAHFGRDFKEYFGVPPSRYPLEISLSPSPVRANVAF